MESLGQLVEQTMAKLGLKKRAAQLKAMQIWPEIVGESIAKLSRPREVRDGIMYVSTPSSSWASELDFQKKEILSRLKEKIGEGAIRDIRFQGFFWKKSVSEEAEETLPELSEAEIKKANQISEVIEDGALKKIFRKLVVLGLRRQKTKNAASS